MTIKKIFYGNNAPSKSRLFIHNFFYILMIFFVWGAYSDFVPSLFWSQNIFNISLFLTIISTLIIWWVYGTGRANFQENGSRSKRITASIVTPFFLMGIYWGSIGHGIPSVYTRFFGQNEEVYTLLVKEKSSSRRSCDHRLKGNYIFTAFPSYICIKKKFFEKSPRKVEIKLQGFKSQMGFLITSIYEQ